MKHFIMCWVNESNGVIDHIAVSDAPLKKDHLNPSVGDYGIDELELDIEDSMGFIRGKDMLLKVENVGQQVRIKAGQQGISIASRKSRRPI